MKSTPSIRLVGIFAIIAITSIAQTFLQPTPIPAPSVTLAWDPVPGAAGYNLYYGGASRQYTNMVSVGAGTNVTVTAISRGSTYYFAVTDLSPIGLESKYSGETVYTSPAPLPPPSTGPKVIASQ